MINWSNAIRSFVFAAIFGAIFAAAITFSYVRANLDAQREQAWEDLLWTSSQLEIEYLRFTSTLALFVGGDPQVSTREVVKRFDILWSRVNLFQTSRVQNRLSSYPLPMAPVSMLLETLQNTENQVLDLKQGQTEAAADILMIFEAHASPLHIFNRDVMRGEQKREAELRDELFNSSTLLTWLSMGAAVVSFALLWFFAAETARYRRIATENRGLFNKAEAASQEKSQFLTMMNHELRTPMNGIMGTIALAKNQGGRPEQIELLDHAADSSAQMNGLLGDILDFSALENGEIDTVDAPFALADLQSELSKSLDAVSETSDLVTRVTLGADEPGIVLGDKKRLRQALLHLSVYLADTAATRAIDIDLHYGDGKLLADVSFRYGKTNDTWEPHLVLGEPQRDGRNFSSDALGPAVARGYVSAMGGQINLIKNGKGDHQAVIRMSVPMKTAEASEIIVGIEARSDTLVTLVKSVLNAPHLRFPEADEDGAVAHVVVVEAGWEEDAEKVKLIRRRHPGVACLALGEPLDDRLFDDVFPLPLDPTKIRTSKYLVFPNAKELS